MNDDEPKPAEALASRPFTDDAREIVRELAELQKAGLGQSKRAFELKERFSAAMGLPPDDPTLH